MFDSDLLSSQLMVGVLVFFALILGVPLLLSLRRRLAGQKKEQLIQAQRRRDEARWQQLQAKNGSPTRKTGQDGDIG